MNMSKQKKSKPKGGMGMNLRILAQPSRGGFSTGKLLALLIGIGVVGTGI
ncbi:uncharacterized protein METZ01_LOCUS332378, partial [marine metagenome]